MDFVIGTYIGDVLDVLRTGTWFHRHLTFAWCVMEPLTIAADEEETLVDFVIGTHIGDVLDVLRGGVPAGRAGTRFHRHLAFAWYVMEPLL